MLLHVLIETLWNVKEELSAGYVPDYDVLIETLWNVKKANGGIVIGTKAVLIETLWNVKEKTQASFQPYRFRINRNIVECKGISGINALLSQLGINRNIVECKDFLY